MSPLSHLMRLKNEAMNAVMGHTASYSYQTSQGAQRDRIWTKRMLYALGVSLAIHLFFLALKWQEDIRERRLKTPLSVVLVNARSHTPPKEPKRLAQADLSGGGLSTTTYASALRKADAELADRLQKMEATQQRLLAQYQQQANHSASTSIKQGQKNSSGSALEAELGKKYQEQGMQPRRAVMTASSAKSVVFAQYYDAMKKQIEAYGTVHFPRSQGKVLYGSLVLMVSVNQEGRVVKDGIQLMKSSGNSELDRQAVAIVRSAAPFGKFTETMRHQMDVLDWVSTFDFTQEGGATRLDLSDEVPSKKSK